MNLESANTAEIWQVDGAEELYNMEITALPLDWM